MNASGQGAEDMAARLDVRAVACRRGGRILFSGLTFALAPGEAALVGGANGVGKSSLLRMIAGLVPHFAGQTIMTGALALADDRIALDADLPLGRALAFWAAIDGARARVGEALDALALSSLSDVPVRILSTGQRKRAVLARVVASGAPIWLLDEPANGLDTASVALLGAAVERHLANGGIVVAASHQPLPWTSAIGLTLSRPNHAGDDEAET